MNDNEKESAKMKIQTPLDRLDYSGELSLVIDRLCEAYSIGKPINFSVIPIGYEDCNVIIETENNKYVAKIFSKDRSHEDIVRYSTVMEKTMEAGVNHPELIKLSNNNVVYSDNEANGISMVLMKFIEGQTFLELGRIPNEEELDAVIEQAVKVNKINYHPPYLFDSWAIPNIKLMFDKIKQFIEPEDIKLVEQVIKEYEKIPIKDLPHCFAHGDFTKANIIKGNDGEIYILDFSVSNWYPRIQELALIVGNLLHEKNDHIPLRDRANLVLEKYDKLNPLTEEEKAHMYAYALAGVAMEFMGSHQEKFIKGNDTEETEFWLNLGRDGLRRELSI